MSRDSENLVYDQNSPVDIVSESKAGGSVLSVTEEKEEEQQQDNTSPF